MKVNILLATYNGAQYLTEQLTSIGNQTYTNWVLWVSDDGSQDETLSILLKFQQQWGESKLILLKGPQQGFVANFMSLISRVSLEGDYYAYADQDDSWLPQKLTCAVHCLSARPQTQPALYAARTTLIDEHGKVLGKSPLFKRPPHFLNALVQNIGGGNTMVFNRAALQLLKQTPTEMPLVAHDWWTYLLIAGAGGAIYYDAEPCLLYRQHSANLIGGNKSLRARLQRIQLLLKGRLQEWTDINIRALQAVAICLTEENKQRLVDLIVARQTRLIKRLCLMRRLGLFRQTPLGNIGLWVGIVLNKV